MTREIAAMPRPDAWTWRLSVADVVENGPFSQFPGVQRTIALLQGHGFVLRVGGAPPESILEPFRPFRFSGDETTECALVDGPVVDLNLMERGSPQALDLRFVTLTADAVCSVSGALVVLVVAAQATTGGDVLDIFDALVNTPASIEPQVFTAGPAGAILAVVRSAS